MNGILVFQHDPLEDMGFFIDIFRKQNIDSHVLKLCHGEMPEAEWQQIVALLILGGNDIADGGP